MAAQAEFYDGIPLSGVFFAGDKAVTVFFGDVGCYENVLLMTFMESEGAAHVLGKIVIPFDHLRRVFFHYMTYLLGFRAL